MANSKQSVNESIFSLFQKLDSDKNGSISRAELRRQLLFQTRNSRNSSEVDKQLEKLDLDNDGKVSFIEICYTFIESILDPEYDSKLKRLFGKYDSDNDGSISMQELKQVVNEVNQDGSIEVFDADGDGVVNYQEFLMLIFDVKNGFRKLRGF